MGGRIPHLYTIGFVGVRVGVRVGPGVLLVAFVGGRPVVGPVVGVLQSVDGGDVGGGEDRVSSADGLDPAVVDGLRVPVWAEDGRVGPGDVSALRLASLPQDSVADANRTITGARRTPTWARMSRSRGIAGRRIVLMDVTTGGQRSSANDRVTADGDGAGVGDLDVGEVPGACLLDKLGECGREGRISLHALVEMILDGCLPTRVVRLLREPAKSP